MKLLFNADFVPMTYEDAHFEALVIDDEGTIAFTGDLDRARARYAGAEEIDMGGKTVTPGFIDPHSHFMMTAQNFTNADLTGAASIAEVQQRLRDFIEKRGVTAEGVVQGNGYDHNAFVEGRHPSRQELDEVSRKIPIIVNHASGHVGAANTRALELAGVDASFADPDGGKFLREADGTPSGPWEELPAIAILEDKVIEPREHVDYFAIVDDMQDLYFSHGVTTCQDGATMDSFTDALISLAEADRIKLDVVSYPMDGFGGTAQEIIDKHASYDGRAYHHHVRFGGHKQVLDGSPQGRTAWMSKPYEVVSEGDDPAYCAYPAMDDEVVYANCRAAIDTNHQILTHCNGDAAADQLLRCYERALADSNNPNKMNLRPVMIHCQTARRDQYEKMAQLKMIPSIFASHIWFWGDVHQRNFGPKRGPRISAAHDAMDMGLVFNFHTDTPIIPCDLLRGVWCAVNRVTKGGVQLDRSQCIDAFNAMRGITINAAYEYFEEDRKGTLEPGKLADLAVLDANPLKVDPMKICDIEVLETIKEGETVWVR